MVEGTLNERALALVQRIVANAAVLRVEVGTLECGARIIDLGSKVAGGLGAGLELARVCTANLADVAIVPGDGARLDLSCIQITTDHPVAACLASQYAGWALQAGKFFAMGSGPMRAAAGTEAIYERIGLREKPSAVVGVLEGRKVPTDEVAAKVAEACHVAPEQVTLLFAPTASLAGGVQIVARSVETALHKLAELGFDLNRVVSGVGVAPLPPAAKDDLAAIGRTNDAILYGAEVTLMVRGDDGDIERVGPKVPSSASHDHGAPFAEIFAKYNNDFYAVDPHLFSPAVVTFQNIETGRSHRFGRLAPEVLRRSFAIEDAGAPTAP